MSVVNVEKKGGKAAMMKKLKKKQKQKQQNKPKKAKEEEKVDIVGKEDALATDNHMDHALKEFVRDIHIPNFSRNAIHSHSHCHSLSIPLPLASIPLPTCPPAQCSPSSKCNRIRPFAVSPKQHTV